MARALLREELWERIEPLLPAHPARPKGGSRQVDDRKALTGVVLVLKTRIPWESLPQEMGERGSTSWRWLRDLSVAVV